MYVLPMKGFIGAFILIILGVLLSFGVYYMRSDYETFSIAESKVNSLVEIESDYSYFESFTPYEPALIQPKLTLGDGKVIYTSSLAPCLTLMEDREWNIFANKNNILPGYSSMMFFDRFWRIGWLGLIERSAIESKEYVFYGPFRYSDLPSRNYIEYLLLGKDVTSEGTTLEVSGGADSCETPPVTPSAQL